MLFVKYNVKNKYVRILIYNKNSKGILYNEFFIKNNLNWINFKNSILEFLYEGGLLKLKKK